MTLSPANLTMKTSHYNNNSNNNNPKTFPCDFNHLPGLRASSLILLPSHCPPGQLFGIMEHEDIASPVQRAVRSREEAQRKQTAFWHRAQTWSFEVCPKLSWHFFCDLGLFPVPLEDKTLQSKYLDGCHMPGALEVVGHSARDRPSGRHKELNPR